ncbi:MAG: hypothetical protein ABFD54_07625 [Armatimonadota bacterium]|nr:hypothetical protein [bacterium]
MDMMDFLKKSLNFGLGAVALSAEKIKQMTDEAVSRGEMSTDEARQFVDDVSKKAEEEKKNFQDWMREQASKMMQQAGMAEANRVTQLEQELVAMERRVTHLESELAELKLIQGTPTCTVDPSTGECKPE